MRIPDTLVSLHDQGIVTEVLRPLMSGKEAQIYLVSIANGPAVAKIYKEANNRSFRQRAAYTEGRKVRNSRDQRAMAKRTKYGREQEEAAWSCTEVDMMHRLHAGGVRVPTPYFFIDGVLVMELVTDGAGNPAPRLGDVSFEPAMAKRIYDCLIREVVRMLCVGVVHGDMSDFNVLIGADGPVIIDFPQSVDSAHNTNARQLLLRDVDNLHRFLARWVPNAPRPRYAEEMWELHQNNALTPDTPLTGRYNVTQRRVNVENVLGLIHDANREEGRRRERCGQQARPPVRDGEGPQFPHRITNPRLPSARNDVRHVESTPNQNRSVNPRHPNARDARSRHGQNTSNADRSANPPHSNARDARPRHDQNTSNGDRRANPRHCNARDARLDQDTLSTDRSANPPRSNAQDARYAQNTTHVLGVKQASSSTRTIRPVSQYSSGRSGSNVEVIVMRRSSR